MKFATSLKKLLSAFVDEYANFFSKTFGTALTLTLFSFIVILVLLKSNAPVSKSQVSILSYFYFRYSKNGIYSLVDLSRVVFLLLVAFLSLCICRLETDKDTPITMSIMISKVKGPDMLLLLVVFLIASAIDFGLVSLDGLIYSLSIDIRIKEYISSNLFFVRIYSPLFLFSMAIYRAYRGHFPRLTFLKICFLVMAFWMFNEFSYESFLFLRHHLFDLFRLPFSNEKSYMIESIFGLFLMASSIIGYHTAMTAPFKIFEEADNTPVGQSEIIHPQS